MRDEEGLGDIANGRECESKSRSKFVRNRNRDKSLGLHKREIKRVREQKRKK